MSIDLQPQLRQEVIHCEIFYSSLAKYQIIEKR